MRFSVIPLLVFAIFCQNGPSVSARLSTKLSAAAEAAASAARPPNPPATVTSEESKESDSSTCELTQTKWVLSDLVVPGEDPISLLDDSRYHLRKLTDAEVEPESAAEMLAVGAYVSALGKERDVSKSKGSDPLEAIVDTAILDTLGAVGNDGLGTMLEEVGESYSNVVCRLSYPGSNSLFR